jgi:hypothetical protein
MTLRRSAVAVSIAASGLIGALGVSHAVAATKMPSPNRSKSSTTQTHKCPHDSSRSSSSSTATAL